MRKKDFRYELSVQMRSFLKELKLSEAEAARQIGVSRQAMNKYVHGTAAPTLPVLLKAEQKWSVTFTFKGIPIFGPLKSEAPTLTGEQLSLFDEPQVLENNAVRIVTTKSETTLTVSMTLKLSA